jgi:hypothetical protein
MSFKAGELGVKSAPFQVLCDGDPVDHVVQYEIGENGWCVSILTGEDIASQVGDDSFAARYRRGNVTVVGEMSELVMASNVTAEQVLSAIIGEEVSVLEGMTSNIDYAEGSATQSSVEVSYRDDSGESRNKSFRVVDLKEIT